VISGLPWAIVLLGSYYAHPVMTPCAKAEPPHICVVSSGISAASRARAAWNDDKTLLDWLNSLQLIMWPNVGGPP
jgi:hypothetical protein